VKALISCSHVSFRCSQQQRPCMTGASCACLYHECATVCGFVLCCAVVVLVLCYTLTTITITSPVSYPGNSSAARSNLNCLPFGQPCVQHNIQASKQASKRLSTHNEYIYIYIVVCSECPNTTRQQHRLNRSKQHDVGKTFLSSHSLGAP